MRKECAVHAAGLAAVIGSATALIEHGSATALIERSVTIASRLRARWLGGLSLRSFSVRGAGIESTMKSAFSADASECVGTFAATAQSELRFPAFCGSKHHGAQYSRSKWKPATTLLTCVCVCVLRQSLDAFGFSSRFLFIFTREFFLHLWRPQAAIVAPLCLVFGPKCLSSATSVSSTSLLRSPLSQINI